MTLLISTPGVYSRPDGIVGVSGPDRIPYLHSLLSQDFENAAIGTVAEFLYLDGKGDHLASGTAVVHAEAVYLIVPASLAADVAERLDRFRFMMQCEVTDLSGDWAVASVRGPGQVEAPGAPSRPMTAAPHAPGIVLRDRDGGVDLVGPTEWVTARVAELDLPAASAEDWDRWRISAARPAWGSEIGPGRRSQELGLLPTHVHLKKGCYPGQESIAKIHNLGRPRRALALLESDAPLAVGAALGEGRRPGEVTSAAATEDGRTIALGLVPFTDGALPATVATPAGQATVVKAVGAGLSQPGA
ncbi:YgfZ/GcvT domain-containing protein [Euzebya tangerina]|uniref:CAF17-like 4Fe-4S cluster assembly/insertion protein YgfZ n=1 Tax=Euzebya tangerina TaxID=591198 RepID=UPI0013C3778F|nr:folate-binding protein [Euzebya tangerina]